MEKYKQTFIEEAKEHIDIITQSLLVLEKDSENIGALNDIFRAAHTLKGSSAMMGYKDISDLTHAMEDIFDNLRRGGQVSSDLIDTLLQCVDTLNARLDKLQKGEDEQFEVGSLIQKLHEKAKMAAHVSNSDTSSPTEKNKCIVTELYVNETELREIRDASDVGDKCFTINVKFSSDCIFKSIRANMVLDTLADKGKIIKTIPSRQEIAEDKIDSELKIIFISKCDEKEIEKLANSICEIEHVKVTSIDLNSLKNIEGPHVSSKKGEPNIVVDTRLTQTVRVHFNQLDKLINLVGELVVNKIALLQIVAETKQETLKRVVGNIDRLTADLHELVMQIRMVPISQIFDRFPRLVRDLSIKKGKKVELIMEGREIEVDRTILDEIGQPLIHLIRNCIDHGIESPEERVKYGKNPTGTIKLTAQRKGDNVIIEVLDDGAGINPEKVKEAAIKKGFITASDAEKMSKDQIINLIFLPGLSTASEITETSGRGVGMDVVKTKINALGGNVHIETHVGKGTKVTIRLPLTLAIIKALLIKDSGQIFAIPTDQVLEVIQAKRKDIKPIGDFEAMIVRDRVIPIIHLHKLLNLPESNITENLEVLIIYGSNENERIGLVVDSVLRQQEILIKTLDETLSKATSISGATILGDGQVVLVLDIAHFLQREMQNQNQQIEIGRTAKLDTMVLQ